MKKYLPKHSEEIPAYLSLKWKQKYLISENYLRVHQPEVRIALVREKKRKVHYVASFT
jgi:hypothetical protein